jgi:hypothetical protein
MFSNNSSSKIVLRSSQIIYIMYELQCHDMPYNNYYYKLAKIKPLKSQSARIKKQMGRTEAEGETKGKREKKGGNEQKENERMYYLLGMASCTPVITSSTVGFIPMSITHVETHLSNNARSRKK